MTEASTPTNIETEAERVYVYPDGFSYRILNPKSFLIVGGNHRVIDTNTVEHTLVGGWRVLQVKPKVVEPVGLVG